MVSFLRADDASLYFVRGKQVTRMSKAGSADSIAVVADAQSEVRDLAIDGTRLYWALDSGKVLAIDKTATVGIPSELASGQAGPSSIALDTDRVYCAERGGRNDRARCEGARAHRDHRTRADDAHAPDRG
jgi:hypothetical protein